MLKRKSDVFPVLQTFKAIVENQQGERFKRLKTDNGTKCLEGD
jgi:hypothetical protein